MANLGFLTGITNRLKGSECVRLIYFNSMLFFAMLVCGCSGSTTFRVVDAETKEPIEGAVALAMWTTTSGLPGLTSRNTAKVVEEETGADGIVRIPVVVGRLALQKPWLKVYKPGYVGWDSLYIYLGCYEKDRKLSREKKRENFSWKNQDLYLEKWKEEYTHTSHMSFLRVPGDKIDHKTSKYKRETHKHEALRSEYDNL